MKLREDLYYQWLINDLPVGVYVCVNYGVVIGKKAPGKLCIYL